MSSIGERVQRIWNTARSAPTVPPTSVQIPDSHVTTGPGSVLVGPLVADEHYFQVRVNEMFLTTQRKWFADFMPMVLAVTEFKYGAEEQVVPFTVGPSLLGKGDGQATPKGMLFTETRVAGLHPYRGDRLTLSVRLYQLKVGDSGQRILSLVEGAAGALDFSTALGSYLKIADVVLEGVEGLLGMGDMSPVVGLRTEFDPHAGNGIISPAFFALIDAPDVGAESLWVRDDRLLIGTELQTAVPYRDADFVLFSVVGTAARDDVPTLPWFEPLWRRVVLESNKAKDDAWSIAKANMSVLNAELMLSPDVTPKQALVVGNDRIQTMKDIHTQAVGMASLSGHEEGSAPEPVHDRSLEILRL